MDNQGAVGLEVTISLTKDSSWGSQEPGRTLQIPLVALMGTGYLLAIKQSSAGGLEEGRAGGKGAGWEPLGRQAARGRAAGSSSPGVLAQEAAAASRYSRERALTLLLPGPLSGSRFPRRLSVHGATNLRHCNPTGPETVP